MASRRSSALAGLAGFVLGATAVAGAFTLVDDEAGVGEVSTIVTSTSTTLAPTWISDQETRLGPSVLLPLSLDVEGGDLVLLYDMLPVVARPADAEMVNDGGLSAPSAFTLTWAGGEIRAEVVTPGNRAARFPLPAGFRLEDVEAIRVDAYWVALPAGMAAEFDPSGEVWSDIAPGVQARISNLLDQPDNFVVKVEYRGEAVAGSLSVVGEERDWARLSGSMIGLPVWTLDFRGDRLPDPLVLETVGVAWLEVEGGGPVRLSGVMP